MKQTLSILVGVVGFSVLAYQLRQINRQAHSDGLNYLYTQSAGIRDVLLAKPWWIPIFRGGQRITKEDDAYGEALLVAELYLNYFEHLAIQEMNLRRNDWETWLSIMDDIFRNSPIVRDQFRSKPNWYAPVLHELVQKRNLLVKLPRKSN